MIYNYSDIEEYLKHKHEFPYKKIYFDDNSIHEMFNKLKNYKVAPRISHQPYRLHNVLIHPNQMLFKNKYYLIITKESDYLDWNILSDMFNEHCRMKCEFNKNLSPHQYWEKEQRKIATLCLRKYGKITPHYMREVVYEGVKECTSHRPNLIMSMIQMFGSKSVLDISAGWGDRLLGAMASNIDYLGVDPNKCLHEGYNKMIKMFGDREGGEGKKYMVLEGEFEKIDFVKLYNEGKINRIEFDLVFSSPPYFDLEIYAKDSTQSSNYGGENEWFNKFLAVALKNAWDRLVDGGVMAININQKNKNETYIKKMLELVINLGGVYLGLISYANEKLKNPQPIWCWRKCNNYKKYVDAYKSIKQN